MVDLATAVAHGRPSLWLAWGRQPAGVDARFLAAGHATAPSFANRTKL
jgi:hypothetical protein